jgi:DNA repair exonuclease SbcCD ATPase subunit
MIPLRVELKGFLCYKQEQEVAFDGASVWLLAGPNGSGKSAIFDAVTYALFGHHRGGGQDAVELINKDSDKAHVAFEFSLEDKRYLIQRTLQRTRLGSIRSTQQIHAAASGGTWEPIEGTGLLKGFKEWIDQHIGLDYETFTSSVLLLQGRAEKLLDSTAKGRFQVLAGIVDLERYERLHKRADEERKRLEGKAKSGRERLATMPEVSAALLLEAQSRIEATDKARSEAQAARDAMRDLEYQAGQWAQLQERLQAARQRVAQTEKMLGEAAVLERNLERLRELTQWLPRLKDLVAERGRIHTATCELAELHAQRDKAAGDSRVFDERLHQAREELKLLQKKNKKDAQASADATTKLRTLHAAVEKLNELDRQEGQQHRLLDDLKRLPADPEAVVRLTNEEVQKLQDLQQALAPLGRLHGQREELARAVPQEQLANAELPKVKQHSENLRAEVDRLKPQVEGAVHERQLADQEATRQRTLVEQAQKQLDDMLLTDGAKVCRLCGQTLTPAHWQEERKRRTQELTDAQAADQRSSAVQKQASEREQALRGQLATMETQIGAAREAYRTQLALADQTRREVDRLQRECALSFQELPQPFKNQVSTTQPVDWLTTFFPTSDDLVAARQEASTLSSRRRALAEATEQLKQWHQLQGQLTTVRQALERLQTDLPHDRAALRQEYAQLATQERVLQSDLAAQQQQAEALQKLVDGFSTDRERLQQRLAQMQTEDARLESSRQHGRLTVERLLKDLPPAWHALADKAGMAEVNRLSGEMDRLIAERTEERAGEVQEARANLELRRREVADLEAQAGALPPECRVALAEAQRLHLRAKDVFEATDAEQARARLAKTVLDTQYEQRLKQQQEVLQLDEELTHARLLAELLGRDRLQLHLIRQAERQVVDFANAVLDRLSGGQLYLRLAGQTGGEDSSTKALELEAHNRHTGEKPINVAFLSGSQRFRVAVGLALGIGQYASRQHRPLESVIIDEGFGCLDRFGRQLMIQELHNLRGHLRCILLVSHQDEFADAFADGYRFELTNGTTVATRFQR